MREVEHEGEVRVLREGRQKMSEYEKRRERGRKEKRRK